MKKNFLKKKFGKLEIFDEIYSESYWGNGSGGGSSPEETRPYKKFLENFINEFNITSIVDLGCGDWQFSQFINFGEAEYLGIDAAKTVIKSNSSKFSNEKKYHLCIYLKITKSSQKRIFSYAKMCYSI